MNRNDAKNSLLRFFTDIVVVEAMRLGYSGPQEVLIERCEELLPPFIEMLLDRSISNPMAITEDAAAKRLYEPRLKAAEKLLNIVEWVVTAYGNEVVPSAAEIRHTVHDRLSKFSKSGRVLAEGFFPFGKEYET